MAQYDEAQLRERTNTLGKLWAWELLPPDEVQVEVATYIL
jgi:hypothetical protein